MKFYMPDGRKELTRGEFIRLYAADYYLESAKQIPKISRSSRFIENEMERLLKNGIRTQQDVAHILAWKIGKIVHKKSVSQFAYASDWQDAEHLNVTRYRKPFELAKLANYIVENIERLEVDAVFHPQSVLNELRNENIAGIGTVYLITLLYFLSKGKYPIYDQFAKKALDAITGDRKPGESIIYKELPEKSTKEFETLMEKEMADYIASLAFVFGDEYKLNRDVDRALWVYGHLFSKESSYCTS